MKIRCLVAVAIVTLCQSFLPQPLSAFELKDGDRVTWLGGAFVERMQAYGYVESMLTAAYPDRNITFRNLGWSGDNVFGDARAVFGKRADGFKRLEKDFAHTKPNVVFVCYGANEAHAGKAGLPEFEAGLNRLLDIVQRSKPRVVLISPHQYEKKPAPLPSPAAYNAKLKVYCDKLQQIAKTRGCHYVDLYSLPMGGLTDNGVHLTEYGYWKLSFELTKRLGAPTSNWKVSLNADGKGITTSGTTATGVKTVGKGLQFKLRDAHLPPAGLPKYSPKNADGQVHGTLRIKDLADGKYELSIDGKPLLKATAKAWADGVKLPARGGSERLQQLREVISKKNELYFHRYRPQNETYLFLFRKHEQGNNAVEIPQFDPLVESQEKEIAHLREPATYEYTLTKVE